MMEFLVVISIAISVTAFLTGGIMIASSVREMIKIHRRRRAPKAVDEPEGADQRRIDELERDLEIGKYSPTARELQLELDVENAMEQVKHVSGFGKITEHEWRLALKKANDRGLAPKVIVCGVGQERHSMAAGQLDILESKNPDVDPRFLAIGLMWRYRPGGEFDQHNGRSDRKVARRAPLRRIVRADGEVEEIRAFGS